eukprot:m.500932 g.500932  ORF g.500932 m.500932 type:complete len:246 (-) comp62516_c0_seq1:406-1143(-)
MASRAQAGPSHAASHTHCPPTHTPLRQQSIADAHGEPRDATSTDCDEVKRTSTPRTDTGHSPNVSSWGGNVLHHDGVYHLWVSEFARGCGLASWLNNSRVAHATASSPEGPFVRHDIALGIFSHNVVPLRAPASFGTGARPFYLFHIGTGHGSPSGGPARPCNCFGHNLTRRDRHCSDRPLVLVAHPGGGDKIERFAPPATATTVVGGNLAHRAPNPFGPWEPVPSMTHLAITQHLCGIQTGRCL